MTPIVWTIASISLVLAVWLSALSRWIRTGHRHDLAERLGGTDDPRWLKLERHLDTAAEVFTL